MKRIFAVSVVSILIAFTVGSTAESSRKSTLMVTFNTQTLKYHCPTCRWAKKCTVNCIVIPLAEAIEKDGVACKVCRGRCR